MTALSSDVFVKKVLVQLPEYIRCFEAAGTIHKGSMVCVNAQGKAVAASDTAGLSSVLGIAQKSAKSGEVVYVETGAFLVDHDSLTAAAADDIVYVMDDATCKASGTNSIVAGKFRYIDSVSGKAVLEIV